jgi:hypothetical protein
MWALWAVPVRAERHFVCVESGGVDDLGGIVSSGHFITPRREYGV